MEEFNHLCTLRKGGADRIAVSSSQGGIVVGTKQLSTILYLCDNNHLILFTTLPQNVTFFFEQNTIYNNVFWSELLNTNNILEAKIIQLVAVDLSGLR